MKKRIITALFFIILACGITATAQAASGTLDNFKVNHTYTCGQFGDVQNYAWFAMYVEAGYEYGILNGKTTTSFVPDARLTYAEAVKTAANLHSIYYTGKELTAAAAKSAAWYQPYMDYALKKGLIDQRPSNAEQYIKRVEYADMIARALPAGAYPSIGQVADNAIPDVSMTDSCATSVYTLYRAGVLAGCDSFGTFRPNSPLTRAEAAAVIARASDKAFRKPAALPKELHSKDIYKKCTDAVFYLERYDSEGVLLGIGSGFFITRDGLAVTNYHVIDGASSAVITTADGSSYDVSGICGYDKVSDLAILKIDGSGFPYLDIGDSTALAEGNGVFAIGSPFGLLNTISDGIISNTRREINGSDFIQFSAPISMGSGGGPVLNTKGQVVGVTCLTVLNGQTLNFAVPINKLSGLSREHDVPLISIVALNSDATFYYRGYYPVPDYGIFVGTAIYDTNFDYVNNVKTYYYRLSDITVSEEKAVDDYVSLLNSNGFEWQNSYSGDNGDYVDVYYNAYYDISVNFGVNHVDGVPCRVVAIY